MISQVCLPPVWPQSPSMASTRLSLSIVALALSVLMPVQAAHADGLEKVRVRLVNGSSVRANVNAIDANGVVSGSDHINGIQADDIVEIDTGRTVKKPSSQSYVLLRMGGRLPFEQVSLSEDAVEVAGSQDSRSVALETVRAVVWNDSAKVSERVASPSTEYDSVIVDTKRGQTEVRGLLEAVNETHVLIEYKGETKKIGLAKVAAIVTANLDNNQLNGLRAKAMLVDGAEIVGVLRGLNGSSLELALTPQHKLEIANDTIAKILIQSQRVQYLSDLEPIRFEETTQFALPRTWQRDKSLRGNTLRVKQNSSGRVLDFKKGIGTRSYTSLVYVNDRNFSHLRANVGIDLETEGHGDCEMIIEGDGIQLWSKRVTGRDDPEPVVVEIKNIKEIALIVRPGRNFDLADHADWADIRFTKSK